MRLKDFLNFFEFDYEVKKETGMITLKDQLGANLGNIEQERFNPMYPEDIIDRLETYYENYVYDAFRNLFKNEYNLSDIPDNNLEHLYELSIDNHHEIYDDLFHVVACILGKERLFMPQPKYIFDTNDAEINIIDYSGLSNNGRFVSYSICNDYELYGSTFIGIPTDLPKDDAIQFKYIIKTLEHNKQELCEKKYIGDASFFSIYIWDYMPISDNKTQIINIDDYVEILKTAASYGISEKEIIEGFMNDIKTYKLQDCIVNELPICAYIDPEFLTKFNGDSFEKAVRKYHCNQQIEPLMGFKYKASDGSGYSQMKTIHINLDNGEIIDDLPEQKIGVGEIAYIPDFDGISELYSFPIHRGEKGNYIDLPKVIENVKKTNIQDTKVR